MDTDGLLTELLSVFFNHLSASLVSDVGKGFCLFFLLLNAKETHFSFVQALFRVLQDSDVWLKCFQVF